MRIRQTERFAGSLVALLERGRARCRFQRLVLAAPAKFLACLNAACGRALCDTVVGEIHRDFAVLGSTELHERVAHLLDAAGREVASIAAEQVLSEAV